MSYSDNPDTVLEIGARASPLSQAQVSEICAALQTHYPGLRLQIQYMSTVGDRDLETSLRTLERTDFFTRDIDAWVLQAPNRVGVHSAKDLPVPLCPGLTLFCLTTGVDPSDSLVLPPDISLQDLRAGAKIATSSMRREEMVKKMRSDLSFCDVRGTIEQRLAKLASGEVDGVVIAEAALIRLQLTHLNRIKLPGATAEGQGQLAIVGRLEDRALKKFFEPLKDA
jgi:hydroxymethylbilane synthase